MFADDLKCIVILIMFMTASFCSPTLVLCKPGTLKTALFLMSVKLLTYPLLQKLRESILITNCLIVVDVEFS
jgi:hypothetical protein